MLDPVAHGKLLPDNVIFDLFFKRLEQGMTTRERGFILDGFPRTVHQAEVLEDLAEIDLVVNLQLREDIIIAKCLGRRICGQCGGNFNLADINVGWSNRVPRTRMPPLLPPPGCAQKMTIRADDTEELVRERLHVYHEESAPVEDFYRAKGKLINFNVGGGLEETWAKTLLALNVRGKDAHLASSKTLAA